MVEVRTSSIHGRGAFAVNRIKHGELFHVAHLLVFDCSQSRAVNATVAGHYVFYIADCPEPDCDVTGLAMSPISFVNHRRPCNASFEVSATDRTVSFTALRDIEKGEEITIDYGDFAAKIGIE
ncbi:MAG: SET domain-containing protein-lysine N-methyltransferase [Alphaproteobacteria bacterium]|nr:SET domain-containing protein-lysine N-methyltransferase [Alphaproteobacteria bacterium]